MAAGTAAIAAVIFAGTDVDDLIILTLLFLSARTTGAPRVRDIVVGQYLGIAALVAVSLGAAAGLLVVPERWIGLIGLVPLALGLWALIRPEHEEAPTAIRGWWAVAALTVANGADNLAVYIPVFRTIGPAQSALTIAVFAVLVGLWLALASWLGGHRRVVDLVERSGRWLVPAVFIAVGMAVIVRSGLLA